MHAPSLAVDSAKKGTAELWITKMCLDDLAEGRTKSGHALNQSKILLPKLNSPERRRLTAHRTAFQSAETMAEGQMHLLDKATLQSTASALHCQGMEFRGATRRRLLRCHMEFEWQELKHNSYDNKPALKRILLLVKPFGVDRVEFDPANPTLFNIALAPEDTSEFLSEEFFAQKLASLAASSEHPDAFWMGLDDAMKAYWQLHPDADISSEAARTLQDAKRVVAVMAFSLDPAIREGANKRIFEDVEKLEAAGRNTTKRPGIWETMGIAVQQNTKLKNALSAIRKTLTRSFEAPPLDECALEVVEGNWAIGLDCVGQRAHGDCERDPRLPSHTASWVGG